MSARRRCGSAVALVCAALTAAACSGSGESRAPSSSSNGGASTGGQVGTGAQAGTAGSQSNAGGSGGMGDAASSGGGGGRRGAGAGGRGGAPGGGGGGSSGASFLPACPGHTGFTAGLSCRTAADCPQPVIACGPTRLGGCGACTNATSTCGPLGAGCGSDEDCVPAPPVPCPCS